MSKNESTITAARVRELLHYDPETGVFTWKVKHTTRSVPGMQPKAKDEMGYGLIVVDGFRLKTHRLAWLYVTGEWPKQSLDHMDGDPSNNRYANLRDIPQSHNTQNMRGATKRSLSGFLGVSPHKARFRARIRVNRKLIHLGAFATPEEAYSVYLEAKRKLHAGNTL